MCSDPISADPICPFPNLLPALQRRVHHVHQGEHPVGLGLHYLSNAALLVCTTCLHYLSALLVCTLVCTTCLRYLSALRLGCTTCLHYLSDTGHQCFTCCFCRVRRHHNLLRHSPLLKNTCGMPVLFALLMISVVISGSISISINRQVVLVIVTLLSGNLVIETGCTHQTKHEIPLTDTAGNPWLDKWVPLKAAATPREQPWATSRSAVATWI